MAKYDLSAATVRRLFTYNQMTGLLERSPEAWPRARKVLPAGFVAPTGYRIVKVDGYVYMAHWLIWLHVTGAWPKGEIDHINGDRADNRMHNLRDVDSATNSQNRKRAQKNSSTGVLGVSPSGVAAKPWRAQIKIPGGSVRYIGLYKTIEEASAAYLAVKRVIHVGCTM